METGIEKRELRLANANAGDTAKVSPGARQKQSWDYLWRSGLAGGVAGSAAKTLVAPLDRVKILFQARNPQYAKYTGSWNGVAKAMRDLYRDEGPRGLYRGHSATLLRIFPYAAIKFLAYEQVRAILIRTPEQETPLRRLLSGSIAGVTSVFFVYPLDLIRVRLAFETKKDTRSTLIEICKKIYYEAPPPLRPVAVESAVLATTVKAVQAVTPQAGLSNFYRGFSASIMGMLPYAGISFMTRDTIADLLRHPRISPYTMKAKPASSPANKPAPLTAWGELLAGGIAGLVSQTASYPLEVIRRRMQVGGVVGDGRRLRVAETAKMIYKERGFKGYWVGLSIGYVKIVPMFAVTFYIYERAKTWLGI